MVMMVTCVSVVWPTGDTVVETCGKVSVPALELVSVGCVHLIFCPVLPVLGAKQSSLTSQLGSLVS